MDHTRQAGNEVTRVAVGPEPIVPGALIDLVAHPGAGAVVLFLGTVRDHSPGRDGVTLLEYEAYAGVVETQIGTIVAEARGRWQLLSVAVTQRLGALAVGETAVAVAVSSAHRADAFAAARYLIDELKSRAPVWKKEHWPGGAEWVAEGGAD
jgi:molybdopterin synthase catalytic subunit